MNSSGSSSTKNLESSLDIARLIKKCEQNGQAFCSFELVAYENFEIYEIFITEMELSNCFPLFYALTWHRKSPHDDYLPIKLARHLPSNTLLHLTCRGLNKIEMEKILDEALKLNLTNILALRGDHHQGIGDFNYAADLVKFMRNRYGSKFCIAVAGYPDSHPESVSKKSDIYYLKEKVDAGADFIITQILFEAQTFIKFVEDCRNSGIKVPIIPGILPVTNYHSLTNLARICSLKLPEKLSRDLERIKEDNEAVQKYGINSTVNLAKEIISSGFSHGFHLFTFNKSSMAQEIWSQTIIDKPDNPVADKP